MERGGRPALSFVGRHEQLRRLRGAFDRAVTGVATAVLVEGEAGAGKTALIRRFLEDIDRPARVVRAGGDEHEVDISYGVIEQLMRGRVPDGGWSGSAGAGAALLKLLDELGEHGEAVLVVEDVHWCDRESVRALTFALRRLTVDPVLTVLSVRVGEVDHLPPGLARWIQDGGVETIALGALTTEEIALLAGACGVELSSHGAERLRSHSGGNPLYTRSLIDALSPSELADQTDVPLRAPRTFETLTLSTLVRFPARTRRLLEAASVLGFVSSVSDVSQVAGEADPLPALAPAVEHGLVELLDAGRPNPRVVFSHPLIRSAIYHDLSGARRAQLHDHAARATSDRVGSLLHRGAATSTTNAELAEEMRRAARSELERGRAATSARLLSDAARLHPDADEHERIVIDLVLSLAESGELGEAVRAGSSVERFTSGPRRTLLEALVATGTGRAAESFGLLDRAWRACDERGLSALVACRATGNHQVWGDLERAVEWGARAVALSGPGIDIGTAPYDYLIALALTGRHALVERLLAQRAAELVEPERQDQMWLLARGVIRLWSDDIAGALDDLARCLRLWARRPRWYMVSVALHNQAEALYRSGRWEDATAGVLALKPEEAQVMDPGTMSVIEASIKGARGEWEDADAAAAAAESAARRYGSQLPIDRACLARARVAMARGDHHGAAAALQAMANRNGDAGDFGANPWRGVYVESLVGASDLDGARGALDRLVAQCLAHPTPSAVGAVARARGLLAAASGHHEEASSELRAAAEAWGAADQPFEVGLTELACGMHLRRHGSRRDAVDRLRGARERFAPLEARPYLQTVDRELAACGQAVHGATVVDRGFLTNQERVVVHHVRRGMSNREVADDLVLSVRTVEYHLANAYQKLGIRSRRELRAFPLADS